MKKNDPAIDPSSLWSRLDAGEAAEVAAALDGVTVAESGQGSATTLRTLHGIALYESGRPAEALIPLQAVLRDEPDNALAKLWLVLALYRAGRPAEAGELLGAETTVVFPQRRWLLEFVRVFWPGSREAGIRQAVPLPEEGAWEDPFAARRAALGELPPAASDLTPDQEDSPGLLPEILRLANTIASADGRRRAAARRLSRAYRTRAEAAYHARRLGLAVRLMERAQALAPRSQALAGTLGYVYLVAGHPEKAGALLEPIMQESLAAFEARKDPALLPNPEVIVCQAWALHEVGRHREALELLSAVKPEGPEDLGAHFVAAVCWLALDREAEFREAFHLATTTYFIDTWEQLLQPFIGQAGEWLRRREAVAAASG